MPEVSMDVIELDVGAGAVAFSTLRSSGPATLADDPYAGFNVCHYTGDSPGHQQACRHRLADCLGVDADALLIPRQTHSVNVAIIGDSIPQLEDTDALVTKRDDVALVVNTADCLPVIFNDLRRGVVGIAHAGWRGLYNGIIEKSVTAMESLGAARADIRAVIGPCICAGCYEVDEDFAGRFASKFGDVVRIFMPGEKPHIDLRAAACKVLARCGIDGDRVVVTPVCSRCDVRLFSARRMGVASGRIATVIRKTAFFKKK